MKKNDYIRSIALALLVLLLYAALSKLLDYEKFQSQLANQVFPVWSVPILVWLIPVVELLTAILLASCRLRVWGLYCSALVMCVFTLYMGLVLLNVFDRVPCNCGGVFQSMGFASHFVFNLFFLILSITGIYLSKTLNTPNATS